MQVLSFKLAWRSLKVTMTFTEWGGFTGNKSIKLHHGKYSSLLSFQVCLDPQQSSKWIYEDQCIPLVPALHHPPWDSKL